jgi:hypothetical protein
MLHGTNSAIAYIRKMPNFETKDVVIVKPRNNEELVLVHQLLRQLEKRVSVISTEKERKRGQKGIPY